MTSQIVIAIYRPKPDRQDELKRLVTRHLPTLRNIGLVTDREAVVVESSDGDILEIFEWKSADAAREAHANESVQEIWNAIADVAEFGTLADLPEATKQFPHFSPVSP